MNWRSGSSGWGGAGDYSRRRAGERFDESDLKQGRTRTVFSYESLDGRCVYQLCKYTSIHDLKTVYLFRRPRADVANDKNISRDIEQPYYGSDKTPWVFGLPEAERVLFNLKGVVEAHPKFPVFVCEGEKDVENLVKAGLIATTAASHVMTQGMAAFLTDRVVIILEDHDEAGRKHASAYQKAAEPFAKSTRIVTAAHLWKCLPNAKPSDEPPPTADISDWLDAKGDVSKLISYCVQVPPTSEAVELKRINISNWDNEPKPEHDWTVKDRIPIGSVTLFSGVGEGGKSTIQLQCSAAVVLGREWLGSMFPVQGPAIFIDAEDSEKVIHKRLFDITHYYGVKFKDLEKDLHLVSLADQDAVLGALSRRDNRIQPTRLYDRLLEMAGDVKPKMIGIASSANVFAGNELDRSQVQQFISLLTRIAIVAEGAVVLISHPSLTGISTGTGISGSTQWHNAVRARFYLKSVKGEDDSQPDTGLRVIEFQKNNYGPKSASITLTYDKARGLFLPVEGVNFDAEARNRGIRQMFLDLLARYIRENRKAGANKGPSYAPPLFAKEHEAKSAGYSQEELVAAMLELLRTGRIIQVEYGKKSAPNYKLAIGEEEKF